MVLCPPIQKEQDRGYKGEDVDRVLCLLASELEAVPVENNGVRTPEKIFA